MIVLKIGDLFKFAIDEFTGLEVKNKIGIILNDRYDENYTTHFLYILLDNQTIRINKPKFLYFIDINKIILLERS